MALTKVRGTRAASAKAAPAKEEQPAQDTIAQAETAKQVSIELTGKLKRLHLRGRLFEKGRVYTLSEGDAETLLEMQHGDNPVFRRFKGTVATVRQEEPVAVESVAVSLAPAAKAAAQAIEIGSAEEEAELGLTAIDQDGDADEDGGVSV